jgi:dTMP kinase
MEKGLFIVLEGGEGAGKTTQINLLKERLPELVPNREFVFTREPGGSSFATEIRSLILSDAAKDASGMTMLGLFMAARADHVENVVVPALAAGKVVICDRYLAATYAYQIVAQEQIQLRDLYAEHVKLVPVPDVTLFFDIDPIVAQARVEVRTTEQNHFDMRTQEFHRRIRAGFVEFFAALPAEQVRTIDAGGSVEDVHGTVLAEIQNRLA